MWPLELRSLSAACSSMYLKTSFFFPAS
uniref:Uncharacterized protein n=1 Tax=Arundo donax TaxID=35708 RepID=A0A0A9BN63_ARUDO